MVDNKDVLIKFNDLGNSDLLNEFLESAKNNIGLAPDNIKKTVLPIKPDSIKGSGTKDVMLTVSGNQDIVNGLIEKFIKEVSDELDLLPSSTNERALEGK
ncbi:hypothetical protein DYG63_06590 [Yersinia enterocolitica]|nr:hypothetical protein [Yersinia enterocolitica]EKN5101583.1 hypothetical protein [Yersinia enterocolitica]